MSKNELIEKAVNIFGGKWPSKSDKCVYMYKFESENIWECGSSSFDSLFTREEFNEAADRLRGKPDWSMLPADAEWLAQDRCGTWKPMQGRKPTIEEGSYWITDHHYQPQPRGTVIGDWRNTLEKRPEQKPLPSIADRYGVEIPWDGRNALPADVDCNCEVEVTLALGGAKYTEMGNANRFNWMLVKSYKVIDERYKPKATPAKHWFEAGELPPVGTKCLCYFDDGRECWHECVVIGSIDDEIKNGYLAVSLIGKHERKLVWVNDFKPIKTDKEKAIEFALSKIHNGMNRHAAPYIIEQLYDAGLLRLPDQK